MTNHLQNESFRLAALRSFEILDTEVESSYDEIAHLAAFICRVPVAFVSFLDETRQWFKARVGTDAREVPLDISFCTHTISHPQEVFIIEDAARDPRFRENPMVAGAPYVRFCASAPLVTADGFAIGTLCIIDYAPRTLPAEQETALKALAAQVVAQLELRRAAIVNRALSERYRQIFAEASDGIHLLDFDGRITEVNEKFCEITNRPKSELLGMQIEDLIAPEDLSEQPIHFEKLRNGETHLAQRQIVRPDGTRRVIEISTKRFDENTIQAIVRDLSERRHLEKKLAASREQLRESQNLFNLFFDNSPTAIILKDEAGRYVNVNRYYEEFFGVKREDLKGKSVFDVFPEDIAESVAANDRLVLETGETLKVVESVASPDGTPHFWLSHKFLIRDQADKKFVGIIAVNITERKQLERDLETARDQALEASRLKSAFLANISHEIRTPMNGISGMSEILLGMNLSDEQRDCAEAIKHSGDALLAVMTDILDFSIIETGKLKLEAVDFDLREMIQWTVGMISESAARKSLCLESSIERDLPQTLCGDAGRLRQVLANFLSNAVKFTERGAISVKVKVENETAERTTLRLTVADTGIGIAPENLEKLFQPFAQADDSLTRKFGGAGLGLAISKRIVQAMDGEIMVKSELGKGSEFSFTATFAKSGAAPASGGKSAADAPVFAAQSFAMLVVDDNEINRCVIVRQLQQIGLTADVAVDGVDALEKIAAQNYRLILMDCQMPRLDGYETTREIRRRENEKANVGETVAPATIIALTAHSLDGEREKCLAVGMNDYLAKPVKAKQLAEMIEVWIG